MTALLTLATTAAVNAATTYGGTGANRSKRIAGGTTPACVTGAVGDVLAPFVRGDLYGWLPRARRGESPAAYARRVLDHAGKTATMAGLDGAVVSE